MAKREKRQLGELFGIKNFASITVNVTGAGKLVTGNFNIGINGNAGTDNNTLSISAPGTFTTSTDPATQTASFITHGNSAQLNVNSSGNSVSLSNGAFYMQSSGGGTSSWTIGNGTAGNASSNNSVTVTGLGSTVTGRSNGSFTNVGLNAGSGNSFQVLNGGLVQGGRVGVGMGNGTDACNNNFQLISGTGTGGVPSYFVHSGTSNTWLQIGTANNSSGNSFRVEAGARADVFGTGTSRKFAVGLVSGADNNYIRVTGAGSQFNLIAGKELSIGGDSTTAGGSGNHVDVYDGGTLYMDNTDNTLAMPTSVSWKTWAANPTTGTSIILLGNNSALNIGDGNVTSLVKVGSVNGHTGVELIHATSTLNFNNGRLTPGVTGNLITGGGGTVNLNGPAYLNISSGFTSTVNRPITGIGSLTKEGTGTLTIDGSNQGITSIYSGNTTVSAGTLSLNTAFLNDSSSVSVGASSFLNLTFGGTDTIGSLTLGGTTYTSGVFDSTNSGGLITGSGSLTVVGVPEPGAAVSLLGGLGMLLGLRRRRS